MAFLLGIVLYGMLSIRQPLEWTMPVWFVLAFLVVPGIVGLLSKQRHKGHDFTPPGFRRAFSPAAWAMFWYASINLMLVHYRVGGSVNPAETFLIGFFVACVYAVLAGMVSGAVGLLRVRLKERKVHEPAS